MFSYEDDGYGYRSAAPRRQGGGSNTALLIMLIILVALVLAVAVIGIIYMLRTPVPGGNLPTTTPSVSDTADPTVTDPVTDPVTTPEPQETEPVPDERGITFIGTPVDTKNIYAGNLILVNKTYGYNFDVNAKKDANVGDLYSFWKPWPKYSYKLTGTKVKMHTSTATLMSTMFDAFLDETELNDYLITSGYRDYAIQQETLNEMIAEYGSESAALRYCAPAGYSEHHTGLAFDAYVFTDEQKTYKLGDEDMPEVYNWIYNNCARFGFIHRYPGNKEALTGYGAESWHFRYVGIPHAAIIEEKNFCLEEYIDFIKDYSYDNYLVATGSDGATYAIYYEGVKLETVVIAEVKDANGNVITPASVSQQMPDKATLHLPIGDVPYEISGNNVDGFIVTVKLGN